MGGRLYTDRKARARSPAAGKRLGSVGGRQAGLCEYLLLKAVVIGATEAVRRAGKRVNEVVAV